MHENPEPTEEENELAHTDRLEEEEAMRGGQSPEEQDTDSDEEE